MQQSRYRFITRDNDEQVRATLGVSTLRPWGFVCLACQGTNMVCHGRKMLRNTKEHSRQLGNGESSNLVSLPERQNSNYSKRSDLQSLQYCQSLYFRMKIHDECLASSIVHCFDDTAGTIGTGRSHCGESASFQRFAVRMEEISQASEDEGALQSWLRLTQAASTLLDRKVRRENVCRWLASFVHACSTRRDRPTRSNIRAASACVSSFFVQRGSGRWNRTGRTKRARTGGCCCSAVPPPSNRESSSRRMPPTPRKRTRWMMTRRHRRRQPQTL
jgi:hypothetical protein